MIHSIPNQEKRQLGSILSVVGYILASFVAALLVLASQEYVMFLCLTRPLFVEPIMRGIGVLLALSACYILVPGTAFRAPISEATIASIVAWGAMWAYPTFFFSLYKDMLVGLLIAVCIFMMIMWTRKWLIQIKYRYRLLIGLPILFTGLIVPTLILKRFLIDVL